MDKLTSRQEQVVNFITKFQSGHGYPPTRREIADEFGFKSANAAEDHLRALEKKGAVILQKGVARGLVVLRAAVGMHRVAV